MYTVAKEFVQECYKATKNLPVEERFNLSSQIRRAALSVHLNIAEGCSRKSEMERKRYFEIARGSLIEVDAALDICEALGYYNYTDAEPLGNSLIRCFSMLSKMISGIRET
ncbi:MAG TPA: four helix bundle protein [Flavisolibacter sp.]|nr:four helix bundle protein [Flavisolibacter sp.]